MGRLREWLESRRPAERGERSPDARLNELRNEYLSLAERAGYPIPNFQIDRGDDSPVKQKKKRKGGRGFLGRRSKKPRVKFAQMSFRPGIGNFSGGSRAGGDVATGPLGSAMFSSDFYADLYSQGTGAALVPVKRLISDNRLYVASLTSFGSFITSVYPKAAFQGKMEFVGTDDDPLDPNVRDRLEALAKQYNVKNVVTRLAQLALTYGRYCCWIDEGDDGGYYLKVHYPRDFDLQWNELNQLTGIKAILPKGIRTVMYDVPLQDLVFGVFDVDPFGNGYEGVPLLARAYWPLMWQNEIAQSWVEVMATRGLGMVVFHVDGASAQELADLQSEWGDAASFNVLFTDEDVTVSTVNTTIPSYDFSSTNETINSMIAGSIGAPRGRMEGVLAGAVTGSETDQDNMAQMYSALQQDMIRTIVSIFELLDPSLREVDFSVEFKFEIKMDEGRKAATMATIADTLGVLEDILNVSQAFKLLGFPVPEGADQDMIFSLWRSKNLEEQAAKAGIELAPLNPMFQEPGGEDDDEDDGEGEGGAEQNVGKTLGGPDVQDSDSFADAESFGSVQDQIDRMETMGMNWLPGSAQDPYQRIGQDRGPVDMEVVRSMIDSYLAAHPGASKRQVLQYVAANYNEVKFDVDVFATLLKMNPNWSLDRVMKKAAEYSADSMQSFDSLVGADVLESYRGKPDCVRRSIHCITQSHPGWEQDKVIAVALKNCGKARDGMDSDESWAVACDSVREWVRLFDSIVGRGGVETDG